MTTIQMGCALLVIMIWLSSTADVRTYAEPRNTLRAHITHQATQGLSTANRGVVGVQFLLLSRKYPVVEAVFPRTPAHQAGLQPGDILLEVNQQSVWGWSASTLDEAISDIPGTQVTFTLQRQQHVVVKTLTVS